VTTTRQALTAVRTEIEEGVLALMPRGRGGEFRFRARRDEEMEMRSIRECAGAGAERLFEVGAGEHVEGRFGRTSDWIGCGTVAPTYSLALRILYPDTPSWRDDANDDAEQIRNWSLVQVTAAPGCALRVADWPPTDEAFETEPWFIKTMVFSALLDVTP
jgi:hypothetical protein